MGPKRGTRVIYHILAYFTLGDYYYDLEFYNQEGKKQYVFKTSSFARQSTFRKNHDVKRQTRGEIIL